MARIPQVELLAHYYGIHQLPVLINSPLRRDNHPSFFIYSPDGNRVLYQDYATGERGDVYSLMQRRDNISFSQLIHKIASERAFDNSMSLKPRTSSSNYKRTNSDIRVKVREWKDYDIEYWQSYGISLKWLKYAEVYPISHKIVYKDGQRYVFHAAKYAYVFVERKEGNVSLKVYQPMSSTFKWSNSNNGSVVGLWTKIPQTGDKLCVCSSLKDALCLWANTGIPSIYVQSETTPMSATAQEVLRNRFKNIYVCFDNDPPGLKDGELFSSRTGFRNIVLPLFSGGKDISDFYRSVGKEEFVKTVKSLFDEQESKERTPL